LCLCTGLWCPLVKIVRLDSDCAVSARGLPVEMDDASSESDSGTGSRCSFFRAQEQRPPWLQQQLSATLRIRTTAVRPQISHEKLTLRISIKSTSSFGMGLFATTITADMGGARFAQGPAVGTLRHWTSLQVVRLTYWHFNGRDLMYLFIDVLEWSVRMLAVADSVASHACLAGVFFSFDQHFEGFV
jgi:hypothetical protein